MKVHCRFVTYNVRRLHTARLFELPSHKIRKLTGFRWISACHERAHLAKPVGADMADRLREVGAGKGWALIRPHSLPASRRLAIHGSLGAKTICRKLIICFDGG